MSHQVTITRTTTTTTTSAILVNTGYLRTLPGLLKLAQLVLGAVTVGLMSYYLDRRDAVSTDSAHFFFLLMAVAFLVATFSLFASCVLSLTAGAVISKTIYEMIYHGIAFILLLAAGINLLVGVSRRRYYGDDAYIACGVMGLINSALYLMSTVMGYRSYKLV